MCGIFGIWNLDGRTIDREILRVGTETLRHRGPDDMGFLLADTRSGDVVSCAGPDTDPALALPRLQDLPDRKFDLGFGFRRLAIFDPSSAGHQPLGTGDGSQWILFNGAVYNYRELGRELSDRGHVFASQTDTEVVLTAYKEWGPSCLERFNGMWALAIWDTRSRELFVARDRFGIKPLYHCDTPARFVFSSEIKALLTSGMADFRPSTTAVASYIAHARMPRRADGATFLDGVSELPAGTYLKLRRDARKDVRYWKIEHEGHALDSVAAIATQRALFDDAVRLRLRADVKVGSCLSGGLDSSSIVATASELLEVQEASAFLATTRQETFSAVYDISGPWDERHYVDVMLGSTGASGNAVVPTSGRLWDELESLVWHQDEPFQSTSIFAQWCLMDRAKTNGVKVLLDGQGADELLGGYSPYRSFLAGLLRSGHLVQGASEVFSMMRRTENRERRLLPKVAWSLLPSAIPIHVLEAKVKAQTTASPLIPEVQNAVDLQGIREDFVSSRSLSAHLEHLVNEQTLPNLLRYEDRNSMAFSLEARVPFLDYRLVNHAFGSGAPYRIRNGWTKWMHRKAMEGRVPSEIAWRRDKVGFATPEPAWLGSSRSELVEVLRSASALRDYLDVDKATSSVDAGLQSLDPSSVWRSVNLAAWLEVFASRTRSRNSV